MHKFNMSKIGKLDNEERRRTMPPEETLLKLRIKDDGSLLDVGCGIGYLTIPASKLISNYKVIGIDILLEILEISREKAEGIKNIEFKTNEEYSFPIEDISMKYVLISNVVHEIQNKDRYFNEVKRVLKDDGYFLIIDWDKRETEVGPPIHERISLEEMMEFGSRAGFRTVESVNVSPYHYGLRLEKER